MKKLVKIVFVFILFCTSQLIANGQNVDNNVDGDGIIDYLEQALAVKFAPEWRFSRELPSHPREFIRVSAQNKDETNYPSSVDYLIDQGAKIQFWNTNFLGYETYPIPNMDTLADMENPLTGLKASDSFYGNGCTGDWLTMEFADDLYGEPNSFDTYFHCSQLSNDQCVITYLLFSPFDNKNEGAGNHRGDWETFSIIVKNLNLTDSDITNAEVDYLLFKQHGHSEFYVNGNSSSIRWVNATHPKVYVAIGSHAIYPEPGALRDAKVDGWWNNVLTGYPGDVYEDIFFGNGLIVQTWEEQGRIINLGEKTIPFSNTRWTQYKGRWGGYPLPLSIIDDSPLGPVCKWSDGSIPPLSWEEWITDIPEGHLKYWYAVYLDCYQKFSTNYVPDPGYNCQLAVDCRHTCEEGISSDLSVWGSLLQAVNDLPPTQTWQVCLMPCHFAGPVTINKPMVLKAIEGPVIIGQQ